MNFWTALLVGSALAMSVLAESHYKPSHHKKPMPYKFHYDVKDPYAGTDFGQAEASDGNVVKGAYSVQLPDGRKQIVKYIADHHKGFIANVNYKGKAQYPKKFGPPITFPPHKYH